MNKKGSFFDYLWSFVFIFTAIICVVIGTLIFNTFSTGLNSTDGVPEDVKTKVSDVNSNWNPTFDAGIILWFVILWIAGIALAFYNDASPVFIVIYLLLTIISFFILGAFGIALQELQSTELASTIASMPMTNFLITYWMQFCAFYAVTLGLALYAKRQALGGY